ncbi:MAG: MarR family winged helix-turn-helix transcriptional regulator [Sphingomonadales bacterium]
MSQRLLTARVWALLTSLRLSAEAEYRRETGMPELDRRLLIALHGAEDKAATPQALNGALGHDKGQVSRALKRLEEAGSVRRAGLRGPVSLTRKGRRITEEMLGTAARRNAALTAGIGDERLDAFSRTARQLTERSIRLLAREKALASDADAGPPTGDAAGAPPARGEHNRLLAVELMTLLIYLQRSAAVAYKRLTGLSSFEWRVLSQVTEHRPLPLARLIAILARDKGQAGRAVKRLEEIGLITRSRQPGRREILLNPTGSGESVYAIMADYALQRNEFLSDGLGRKEIAQFLETLDRLIDNADRLLDQARRSR